MSGVCLLTSWRLRSNITLLESLADHPRDGVALPSSILVPLPADLSGSAGHCPACAPVPSLTGAARAGTLSCFLLDPQGLRQTWPVCAFSKYLWNEGKNTRVWHSGSQKGLPPWAA